MRKTIKLLAAALLLSLLGCTDGQPGYTLTDGSKLRFDELHGKVVLINYWAVWCKPCREEIPELNAFQQTHGDQVQLLAVNFDGVVGDTLTQQANELGIKFPVLTSDPRQQFAVKASGVLPETLVIDREGNFQQVLLGPQNEEKLASVLQQLSENH
ncbi:TlpA family protein disulfide reductase [Porticoccus sp.]